MKKRGFAFADVEEMAAAYPGVTVGTSYGTPALRVGKKFMARLRDDDPDVMVLTPFDEIEQRFLMETQPDVFFQTPHYVGWPTLLIRLSKVDRAQLAELIEQSWGRLATPKLLSQRESASQETAKAPAKVARKRAHSQ